MTICFSFEQFEASDSTCDDLDRNWCSNKGGGIPTRYPIPGAIIRQARPMPAPRQIALLSYKLQTNLHEEQICSRTTDKLCAAVEVGLALF